MRIWLSTKTQDEEFNDLRAAGHTGSLNDMQFAYLAAAGYSGALADKMAAAAGGDFTAPVLSGNSFNDTDDEATFTTTEGGTFVWATHLTTETLTANGSGGWTGSLLESGTDTVATSGESTISAAYTATTGTGGESRKFSYYIRDAAGNDSNVITESFTVNTTAWAGDATGGAYAISSSFSATASQQGTMSVWIYVPTSWTTGTNSRIIQLRNSSSGCDLHLNSQTTGRLHWVIENSSGTVIYERLTNSSTYAVNTWYHILWSFDLSIPTASIYVNDVAKTTGFATSTGPTVGTPSAFDMCGVFANPAFVSDQFEGYIAEPYFDDTYYDLSVEANRRKFITAAGKPADLTGVGSPSLWINLDDLATGTNSGSGGNLTVTGTIASAPSTPWD